MIELEKIDRDFTICKMETIENVDLSQEFVFVQKTLDEISMVCESAHVPENAIAAETGWKALKVSGTLDFGLIGIIAGIANVLAEVEISIFVISTYDTDYVLIKADNYNRGIQELRNRGYVVSASTEYI